MGEIFKNRNLYLFSLTAALLIWGIYSFYDQAVFYFHKGEPVDLGTALDADPAVLDKLQDGDYVKIRGIRSLQGGMIEPGVAKEKQMIYYFLGSKKFVVIEPMSPKESDNIGGLIVLLTGRVYNFKTNGVAAKYRSFIETQYLLTMDEGGWLLNASEAPGKNTTVLAAFILFCTLLVAVTVWAAFSLTRRGKGPDEEEEEEFEEETEEHTEEHTGDKE